MTNNPLKMMCFMMRHVTRFPPVPPRWNPFPARDFSNAWNFQWLEPGKCTFSKGWNFRATGPTFSFDSSPAYGLLIHPSFASRGEVAEWFKASAGRGSGETSPASGLAGTLRWRGQSWQCGSCTSYTVQSVKRVTLDTRKTLRDDWMNITRGAFHLQNQDVLGS